MTYIETVKELEVMGTSVRPGDNVYLNKMKSIMLVDQVVRVNGSYLVLLGYQYYDQLKSEAADMIKVWQFRSQILSAASPLEILTKASVSWRMVQGVRQYTTELHPETYCY